MGNERKYEWMKVERAFNDMNKMSCRPDLKRLPKGYVTDENKSVVWNREQVEKNNKKYDDEVARLNTAKNKARDQALESAYKQIQEEVGHGISRDAAKKIWYYAWERGHANGFASILVELGDIEDILGKVLS